jgi:SAM-dependent methyltransferase
MWPLVRDRLPAPPARVVEIGCGPLGGFVPELRSSGYEVVGVDPKAPDEEEYRRSEFEHVDLPGDFDAVVASTSLHHVVDPAEVIDRVARVLASEGTFVVVEWAWEDFDEPTARWCFERLGSDEKPGWLRRRRDEWAASGQEWGAYLSSWAEQERLHSAAALLRLLDERFDRRHLSRGPYFFAELSGTSMEDEQAAIDAGEVQPTRIEYVGTLRRARSS